MTDKEGEVFMIHPHMEEGVPSRKRGSRPYDLHWKKEFWFLYSSLRKKEQRKGSNEVRRSVKELVSVFLPFQSFLSPNNS